MFFTKKEKIILKCPCCNSEIKVPKNYAVKDKIILCLKCKAKIDFGNLNNPVNLRETEQKFLQLLRSSH